MLLILAVEDHASVVSSGLGGSSVRFSHIFGGWLAVGSSQLGQLGSVPTGVSSSNRLAQAYSCGSGRSEDQSRSVQGLWKLSLRTQNNIPSIAFYWTKL